MRQPAAFRLGLLAAVAGCGATLPERVPFQPTPGGLCEPNGALSGRAWDDYQAEIARLAADVHAPAPDTAIVLEQIRVSVRAFADREGCQVRYRAAEGTVSYDLDCGKLKPELEAYRVRLVTAVRARFPKLLAMAGAYRATCRLGGPPWAFARSASDSAQGRLRGHELTAALGGAGGAAAISVGCEPGKVDACKRGCDNGSADACAMAAVGAQGDPVLARALQQRECDLRLDARTDLHMDLVCASALAAQLQPGGSRQKARETLDRACELEPAGVACIGQALLPTSPLYDAARAERVAERIDSCAGPKCSKVAMLTLGMPGYTVERGRRARDWLVERCRAHDPVCLRGAVPASLPSAPHRDAAASGAIREELEKGCAGSVTFGDESKPRVCQTLFFLYYYARAAETEARAAEVAERLCDGAEPNCESLASCYLHGRCGKTVSPDKAREAYARECAARLLATPGIERSAVWSCKLADGTQPLPP